MVNKRPLHHADEVSSTPSLVGVQAATLGNFLRQQRLRKHVSRALLAHETGLSESTLADFELNRGVPSYPQIRLLARHLELTETELLIKAGYIRR